MPWKKLTSETVVDRPYITIERNSYETETLKIINDYYVVRKAPFVLVVANVDDRVLMIRQYRPATGQSYLCLPAGYVNAGESIEAAAGRELAEETGFTIAEARTIAELHPLPGFIDSPAHVLICRALPSGVPPTDDEAEAIVLLNHNEITEAVVKGEINEMQAVSALLVARLFVPPKG